MKLMPHGIRQTLISLLRVIIAIAVLLTLALLFIQERMIFFPEKLSPDHHFAFSSPYEERWFDFDSLRVNSLLFKSASSNSVILFFHGNAGSLDSWGYTAEELAQKTGMNVWVIDYPGFGKSEGKIKSEAQLHSLAKVFYAEALKTFPKSKPFVMGRSIGSGIAVKLASEVQSQGLILESPYLSLTSLAQTKFPFLPILFLLRYTFHSDQWISKVNSKILILQGENDEVIPINEGEALSKINPETKFIKIKGGHHNDLAAFPEYWTELDFWISKLK